MFRVKTYMCYVLATILFVAASAVASPPWSVRTWQSDDGLPDNSVLSIDQTPDGFLWVLAMKNLVRFDGMQFRDFPLYVSENQLGEAYALCVDRYGRIWVAKEKGSIVCVEKGRPTVIIAPDKNQPHRRGRMLVEDNEGAIWVTFNNGSLVRLKDGSVRFLTTEDGLPAGGLTEMAVDSRGHLWATKPGWLGVFRGDRFCLMAETPAERLCASRTGGVWLCDGRQIYKYTEPGGLSEKHDLPQEVGVVEPTVLQEDRAGRLWIGTRLTGLFCYNGTNISKVDIVQQTIFCIKEDREGNIWVGTRGGGLKQLKPRIAELLTAGASAPFEGVQSICKDSEGQLWAVFWNSGTVARYVGHAWSLLLPREGWDIKEARCVAADPKGGVWIGTRSKGLYRWQDGAVTHHVCSTNGLLDNCVNALCPTESGELWIGAGAPAAEKNALLCWKDGKLRVFPLPAGSGLIKTIEVDGSGDCWAATARGVLVRVQGDTLVDETKKILAVPYSIRALLATPDNSLWIGFVGMGLGRLKEGRFTNTRMEQGLHDDFISHILSDRRGRLWLASNRGIFSVREKDFDELASGQRTQIQSVAYTQKDGLAGLQASYDAWPGALRDAEGRLFFAMQSGVATVYAEEVNEIPEPPSVFIDRVSVNGKVVALYEVWKSLRSSNDAAPLELGQVKAHLRLPPGERQVEFSFTAPRFTMPESVGFKYRLQGLDKDWLEAGARRSILYSQLAPGHYRFLVTACNRSGVWNETGAAMELTVEPYWWETGWFRVGGPLSAFGLVGVFVVSWLRRRYRSQLERLELQQAMARERARIAADLHDDVGSGLTEIALLSDVVQLDAKDLPEDVNANMQRIFESASEMAQALDEIVWAVNPKNDTLEELITFVGEFAQAIVNPAGLRCQLDMPLHVPSVALDSSIRHQLCMILKESLHNVIKHAHAREITLRIGVQGRLLEMSVSDDGVGFDPAALREQSGTQDGLVNMHQRMAAIGGSCEIHSVPGQGTRVLIQIKIEGLP